jgi:hypothetical protein
MPHNVYTGDEEGRVVRSFFFDLQNVAGEMGGGPWYSRKAGWANQVEYRGGTKTKAVWGPVGYERLSRERKEGKLRLGAGR